ncbi:MAG: hypothetical protein K2Y29_05640 [Beijerinckiaceae bacterium]|nr:hypothetical protein [Beijerinckiaceae bacterium]
MVAGAQPVAPEKGAMAQAAPDERGGRTAPDQGLAFEVSGPVLDENALDALLRLGGDAFVTEVAAQFSAEGTLLLLKVARAVGEADAEADAAEFASHTHALRSSAANVGARRLYQLCLHWRETPSCELAISGSARFVLLQKEFDAAQRALRAWRDNRPDGAAEPAAIRA